MAGKLDISGNMYLRAAQAILSQQGQPMHSKDIGAQAIASGLVKTKSPNAVTTMGANLYGHIKKHGTRSPFVQVGKATFGLWVWSRTP